MGTNHRTAQSLPPHLGCFSCFSEILCGLDYAFFVITNPTQNQVEPLDEYHEILSLQITPAIAENITLLMLILKNGI